MHLGTLLWTMQEPSPSLSLASSSEDKDRKRLRRNPLRTVRLTRSLLDVGLPVVPRAKGDSVSRSCQTGSPSHVRGWSEGSRSCSVTWPDLDESSSPDCAMPCSHLPWGDARESSVESELVVVKRECALSQSPEQEDVKHKREDEPEDWQERRVPSGRRCDICGKVFSTTGHRSRHTRIHSGIKPFMCEWPGCGKVFNRADNCRQHERIHFPRNRKRERFEVKCESRLKDGLKAKKVKKAKKAKKSRPKILPRLVT